MDSLLNGPGTLATDVAEKSMILDAYFVLVFSGNASPQEFLTQKTREKVWSKEGFFLVEGDWVRDDLGEIDFCKSWTLMGHNYKC